MQMVDQDGSLAEPALRLFRLFLQFLIFLGAVAACRWGIRTFLLNRGGRSARWRNSYSAMSVAVLAALLLLRGPAEKLLTALGDSVGRLSPQPELAWVTPMLVGVYYAVIATAILFLAIHAVGVAYGLGERGIDAWQARLRADGIAESSPRLHASRIARITLHSLSIALAGVLVLVYFFYGFAVFPRTRVFTSGLLRVLTPPLQDMADGVENYLPNLAYLFVIWLAGWILLKGLKYFFTSIQRGTIVFEGFPPEWAQPTYKLARAVLFLLALMVSFPYLPGAHSPFFRGFSLFFGALVTFGSSGVIGNLFAGILLTYQRAFKLGDVVRIEGVYGKVAEKTLLITRVVTVGNEHVTIPNSKVLADSVTNYSRHGLSKGFAIGIAVTIGYDVDWRVVHKLLLEGAARTEQIDAEPTSRVMEQAFGNYSVEYELRAWTKDSEDIFGACAALRRNILDAFADAGVEIMTPTILSHRDASGLAVPLERFPKRSHPQGIIIHVDPS